MSRVVIIGAGPSALFAAKSILENSSTISVDIFEQGKLQTERICPADYGQCRNCSICATLQGVGGAGLFSDGKLVLDLTSGGKADGISQLSAFERQQLEDYIKSTFVYFDGVSEEKNKPSKKVQNQQYYLYKEKNLKLKFYDVLHMGTQNLLNITTNFVKYLCVNYGDRFKLITETTVYSIEKCDDKYSISTSKGNSHAEIVVAAVGKSGVQWLNKVLKSLGCRFISHDYFFGFRLETKIDNVRDMVKYSFDPKIYRIVSDRKIKIHCVCRQGQIRYSRYRGSLVVGGHSPYTQNNSEYNNDTMNSNFNVLVSFDKEKFPPDYLLDVFRSNSDRIIVQKLVDFTNNHEMQIFGDILPTNLSMVQLGNLRSIMDSIDPEFSEIVIRFLTSLAELYPGIMDGNNLLYSPAIEWDMDTVTVNKSMETEQKNLFAIGDGAGLSQGIVYSAATGIIAAKEIVIRLEEV